MPCPLAQRLSSALETFAGLNDGVANSRDFITSLVTSGGAGLGFWGFFFKSPAPGVT